VAAQPAPALDPVSRLAMALAEILPAGVEVEVRLRRLEPKSKEPPAAVAVRPVVSLQLPQPPEVARPVARRMVGFLGVRPELLGFGALVEGVVYLAAREDVARGARPRILCDAYGYAARQCGMRDWRTAERLMRSAVADALSRDTERAVSVMGLVADMRCPLAHVLYRLLELVGDDLAQGSDR
jgi:hypothetical protein